MLVVAKSTFSRRNYICRIGLWLLNSKDIVNNLIFVAKSNDSTAGLTFLSYMNEGPRPALTGVGLNMTLGRIRVFR